MLNLLNNLNYIQDSILKFNSTYMLDSKFRNEFLIKRGPYITEIKGGGGGESG